MVKFVRVIFMLNKLQRLKKLRADVSRTQSRINDIKLIESENKFPNSLGLMQKLIDELKVDLADRQREHETLTVEVTNELHSKLTDHAVIRVLLLRHVKGMKFDSIARRIGCSSRWARKLYRHGLETLSADQ